SLSLVLVFCFRCSAALRDLHSFPTRRSSDLSCTSISAPVPLSLSAAISAVRVAAVGLRKAQALQRVRADAAPRAIRTSSRPAPRSEEHTSELQSPCNLVCRLLLEKKKKTRLR